MRKIILTIAALFMALVLSGCGNERLFEVGNDVNTFNYGFVSPDSEIWFQKFEDTDDFGNTVERVKVKDRYINDRNGMVIVPTDDNKVYYTHSSNIILLNE